LRGQGKNDDGNSDSDSDESSADSGHERRGDGGGNPKRGMEEDSSDEEEIKQANSTKRKRKASDALSMLSGKTGTSTRKGIHRPLGGKSSDAMSVKSGGGGFKKEPGTEYSTKKAKGDMKQRGKLDPYAYIPLTRNTLNKRLVGFIYK